jgi:hypothetical protein
LIHPYLKNKWSIYSLIISKTFILTIWLVPQPNTLLTHWWCLRELLQEKIKKTTRSINWGFTKINQGIRTNIHYRTRRPYHLFLLLLKKMLEKLVSIEQLTLISQKPFQPPYLKWCEPNQTYEYHDGAMRHNIENCHSFKDKRF